MANRITYNSKNIDFTKDVHDMEILYPRQTARNMSVAGVMETITNRADCTVQLKWRWLVNANATDATLKRNLRQWEAWAQSGRTWTFARDSGEVVNTTITQKASAGAISIIVTSASGIDNGGLYVLRSASDIEVVKVDSQSGTTITLTETLNHSYDALSRFRSEQFWPAVLSGTSVIIEKPPLWYDVALEFTEDLL